MEYLFWSLVSGFIIGIFLWGLIKNEKKDLVINIFVGLFCLFAGGLVFPRTGIGEKELIIALLLFLGAAWLTISLIRFIARKMGAFNFFE